MKLNKLFIGAIAALASAAMVACSDDAPDVNNGGENQDGGGYLAVNIVTPTAGSRATGGDFTNGKTNENRVESVTFFLYNEDGTPYQDPQTYPASDQPGNKFEQSAGTEGSNVEKILNIIMVIKNQGAGTKLPYQFLTVLNLDQVVNGATIEALGSLNMSMLRNRINNDASNGTAGSFVISNSVYVDNNGKEICATEIPNVYTSEDEAKAHAVEVYVERVVARVDIEAGDEFDADNLTYGVKVLSVNEDGTTTPTNVTVKQEITGIGIANSISHSYLFKNVANSSIWTQAWASWTDPNNYRSYWAQSATKQSSDPNAAGVTYTTNPWNGITSGLTSSFYVQENTTSKENHYTSVIAAVQHKVLNTTTNEYEPYAMIKWAGNVYLPASYPTLMANVLTANGYRVKEETKGNTTYRSIKPEELAMITEPANQPAGFEQWETCCELTATAATLDFVVNNAGTYEDKTAEDINTYLQTKLNRAQYWNDGMAYYYVPIEHFGTIAPYNVGVVRNHLYKLSITGLTGLGTPVFDPDEEIIPKNPDENTQTYFLAARINILAWKIVNQNVNFGE